MSITFNILDLFIWLHWVLVAAGRFLSCGMRTLSCSMHVGSSSLTRDRNWAPCVGSMESYPLRHQGSPCTISFKTHIIMIVIRKLWLA